MSRSFSLPTHLIIILLLLLVGATSHEAHAFDCPEYKEPKISIEPLYATPNYDDSVTLRQISQLGDQPDTSTSKHEIPVGLTTASLTFKTSFEVASNRHMLESTYCAQISKFTLNFGFDNVRVYLARELPQNSCGYQLVRTHESRHVAVDREIINIYLPQLKELLTNKLRDIGVTRTTSPAMARSRLQDEISDFIQTLSNKVAQTREDQQKLIDTPEEYRRLSTECNGQISRIVSSR